MIDQRCGADHQIRGVAMSMSSRSWPAERDFEQAADRPRLERTAAALRARGFAAEIADSAAKARSSCLPRSRGRRSPQRPIGDPARAGHHAEIDESRRYDSVRARLAALDRETQGREMLARRRAGLHPRERTCDHRRRHHPRRVGDRQPARGVRLRRRQGDPVVGHQKLVSDLRELAAASSSTRCRASSRACRASVRPAA